MEENEVEDNGVMPPGLDVYQPKERFIFKYFNGEKMVVADPLVLYKRIQGKATELSTDMSAASFPGYKKADDAYENLSNNLRTIFRIKPLEEGGLTPTELEDLLNQFLEYSNWAKKKWNLIPISPTETSASTDSSSADASATSNTTASGSTEKESKTDVPTSSPLAPASAPEPSTQAWSIG